MGLRSRDLPVRAETTGGKVSDFKGFDAAGGYISTKNRVFLTNRGYDSDHIRTVTGLRCGTSVIPCKTNRKMPIEIDAITYALRNHVERYFNKLKCLRILATRYYKKAESYLDVIHISSVRWWMKSLSTCPMGRIK